MTAEPRTLDEQREEFARRRLIATPIAGLIIWTILGLAGAFLPLQWAVLAFYIGTGSTVYMGMLVSRFTGENFLDKTRPKNAFDMLFFLSIMMAMLVFAIAIPFQLEDPTSLPLSLGILTGLMWVPITWIIRHWIGVVHALSRTVLVLGAWYAFPDHRFTVIPAIIVALYIFAIIVLERRWRGLQTAA